jgi:tetratricopeptide (TPR) repeat protein
MKMTAFIASRLALLATVLALADQFSLHAAEPLPETYRTAKAALEAGDPAKAVALLEPRRNEAQGEQRGPLLFTLGVALLKVDRPAEAERCLDEARAFATDTARLIETWALLGDARAAQSKNADATAAYLEAARAGAGAPANPLVGYASARASEIAAADFLLKGDALSAVGKLRTAAELSSERTAAVQARLNEIAGNRKLRGEATAAAVFALGEIEERAGHLPEAIAYYQRVFVSWMKFPAWTARSYLRAAECFEKLGRRRSAVAHLQEMLRNANRFRDQPELAEARRRLREWAPPTP